MNFKEVSDKIYMKSEAPKVGDLFVVVRKNNHQTPYLIIPDKSGGTVSFLNLQSYYTNYTADTIGELVNLYISDNTKNNKDKINPIIKYFFVKSNKVNIAVLDTFGYKEIWEPSDKWRIV